MSSPKRRYLDVLLGVFVALGLSLLVVLVFVLGKERRLFDSAAYINARFPNVAGLDEGAQVMLAGVVVGHVSDIRFPSLDATKGAFHRDITVVMRISDDMMPWVRKDSIVRVDSKGLLGDKTINITLGSPDIPAAQDGDILESIPPIDLNDALGEAKIILDNVTKSVISVRKFMDNFIKEGGDRALAQAATTIKNIAAEVESGEGILHQIIYSSESGDNFNKAVKDVQRIVTKMTNTANHIENMVNEVESGEGLLHALVYDPVGSEILASTQTAIGQIETAMVQVNEEIRKIRGSFETTEGKGLLTNLDQTAANLNAIVSGLKAGEGTLGRLLVDPSVFEDVKLLLGNVRRNGALKALIRYGINRKEKAVESDTN